MLDEPPPPPVGACSAALGVHGHEVLGASDLSCSIQKWAVTHRMNIHPDGSDNKSVSCQPRRFAARQPGLAFGLVLAVRPAGLAEVSRVNGAPQSPPDCGGR